MDRELPLPAERLLQGQAGVIEPTLVQILGVAISARTPGESGDGVEREANFAFGTGKLDFAADRVPLDDVSLLVVQRHASNGVPSVGAIEPTQPPFKQMRNPVRQ